MSLTSHSSEALLEQVKSLTIDDTKYDIRSDHLAKLLAANHHTAWAVGTKPYPPFIQNNPKVLSVIREIRNQAARAILEASQEEFNRQATKLRAENDAILSTVEALQVSKKDTSLLATRMDDIGVVVGWVISRGGPAVQASCGSGPAAAHERRLGQVLPLPIGSPLS